MYSEAGIINYVNGNRYQLMKKEEYRTIKSAETIEELKLKLQNTVYGKSLVEDSSTSHKSFKASLYKSLEKQIETTKSFTTDKSAILIDFYKEKFQLDNFIYLWACKEESPKSLENALDIHPLGIYPELNFIKVTQSARDTWKFCLENTPLNKYIEGLSHELLKEDIQYVRSVLQKRYIELLYEYSKENNYVLSELVQFEGDRRIIEILYSTIGSKMPSHRKKSLFPIYSTFTEIHRTLLLNCKTADELNGVLSTHNLHRNIIGNEKGMEDALIREEIRICNKSFYVYDDPSVVYTQLKLQELEVRNLIFIADCIIQGYIDQADEIVDVNQV